MILYTLRCHKDHEFEAWFRDSALYDQQLTAGALRCPHCGSRKVEKSLMAPSVMAGRSRRQPEGEPAGRPAAVRARARPVIRSEAPSGTPVHSLEAPPAVAASVANSEAQELRQTLLELRRQIEENFDYVGPAFAEEARKIHYGEVERRSIYGETSEADAEALREEGVAVQQIPWVPRGD